MSVREYEWMLIQTSVLRLMRDDKCNRKHAPELCMFTCSSLLTLIWWFYSLLEFERHKTFVHKSNKDHSNQCHPTHGHKCHSGAECMVSQADKNRSYCASQTPRGCEDPHHCTLKKLSFITNQGKKFNKFIFITFVIKLYNKQVPFFSFWPSKNYE